MLSARFTKLFLLVLTLTTLVQAEEAQPEQYSDTLKLWDKISAAQTDPISKKTMALYRERPEIIASACATLFSFTTLFFLEPEESRIRLAASLKATATYLMHEERFLAALDEKQAPLKMPEGSDLLIKDVQRYDAEKDLVCDQVLQENVKGFQLCKRASATLLPPTVDVSEAQLILDDIVKNFTSSYGLPPLTQLQGNPCEKLSASSSWLFLELACWKIDLFSSSLKENDPRKDLCLKTQEALVKKFIEENHRDDGGNPFTANPYTPAGRAVNLRLIAFALDSLHQKKVYPLDLPGLAFRNLWRSSLPTDKLCFGWIFDAITNNIISENEVRDAATTSLLTALNILSQDDGDKEETQSA